MTQAFNRMSKNAEWTQNQMILGIFFLLIRKSTYTTSLKQFNQLLFLLMSKQDPQKAFPRYFLRQLEAHVALWLIANRQMSIDQVTMCVSQFRSSQLKIEFMEKTFDYSSFQLISHQDQEEGQAQTQEILNKRADLSKFKEMKQKVILAFDRGLMTGDNLLWTGVAKEVKKTLLELKVNKMQKMKSSKSFQNSKFLKLKLLIDKIIQLFCKVNKDGIAEKIINYGGIDPVIVQDIFSLDTTFRINFTNILSNCNTFKESRKYKCQDIDGKRRELTDAITSCLIAIQVQQDIIEDICLKTIQNPQQNLVAMRKDLTNSQKQKYYQSEFYQSGLIKKYAQIRLYDQSLEFKAKEEITKILKLIEELSKNTRQIVSLTINYKFFELLKVQLIKSFKKNIFQFVKNECPNYFKAFKIVKYQNKSPASLMNNEELNLKMDIRSIFLKIKLPFEEWQIAQEKIMSRDYGIIDELTLKLKGTTQLMEYIFDTVEPYFHRQEKEMDYESEVQLAVLQQLMKTDISDKNFDVIMRIANETLSSSDLSSEWAEQLNGREKRLYQTALNNSIYKDYCTNQKRDIKEETYQKRWKMIKSIYQNNLEDKIQVTFSAIDKFVGQVIKNGGKIPSEYPQYIINFKKLQPFSEALESIDSQIFEEPLLLSSQVPKPSSRQISQPPREQVSNSSSQIISKAPSKQSSEQFSKSSLKQIPKQDPEILTASLNKEFQAVVNSFYSEFVKANNGNSKLERICQGKYSENAVNMIRDILKQGAFENEESPFFARLAQKPFILRQTKSEFREIKTMALEKLKRASEILVELERLK